MEGIASWSMMKISNKAALYSAIVFPGAGYFIVKRKPLAYLFLGLTLLCLWPLSREIFYKANRIAEQILQGSLPYSITSIREQIHSMPGLLSQQTITGISIALILLWSLGILDAYRVGKKLDARQ